jgi:hypothetical protein
MTELQLTPDEQHALDLTAELAGTVRRIIGDGPQAEHDWAECARIIHDIQCRILAQLASRTDPPYCRPLGGSFREEATLSDATEQAVRESREQQLQRESDEAV